MGVAPSAVRFLGLAGLLDGTTLLALLLVIGSAAAHATWNLLLKRAQRPEVFAWWLTAFAVAGALPVAGLLALRTGFEPVGVWYVVGTTLLHICYFVCLSRSLARSDLALAYPIARGVGTGLAPALAAFTLGEMVSGPAWAGIGGIVAGIYAMAWWGKLRRPAASGDWRKNAGGVGYALLTGVCIALYTVTDKRGVAYISPFLYLYLMSCGVAVGMLPYIIRSYGIAAVVDEWRGGAWAIVAASGLLFLAYGLVLTAMQFADASYVAPARESGLLFGILLGAAVLKERVTAGQGIGAALIVGGLAVITIFR